MRRQKRLRWLAGVIVTLAIAYWWLFVQVPGPGGEWAADVAEWRRLAQSMPGDKPTAVRVERVADFRFPGAIVGVGKGWGMRSMAVYSYQLVFPTRTALIDTALAEALPGGTFDPAAFARVTRAMNEADFIVVTHEHSDHLGGLVAQSNVKDLMRVAKLHREQLSHPEVLEPSKFPPEALQGYAALGFERALAVAPGVVLVRAPGHTPGSQLVFVQCADGREYLFLGDVAWRRESVDEVRERPRAIALFIGEDRPAVVRQLEQLHALSLSEPALHQIPGHDPTVIDELVARRLLEPELKSLATPPSRE